MKVPPDLLESAPACALVCMCVCACMYVCSMCFSGVGSSLRLVLLAHVIQERGCLTQLSVDAGQCVPLKCLRSHEFMTHRVCLCAWLALILEAARQNFARLCAFMHTAATAFTCAQRSASAGNGPEG